MQNNWSIINYMYFILILLAYMCFHRKMESHFTIRFICSVVHVHGWNVISVSYTWSQHLISKFFCYCYVLFIYYFKHNFSSLYYSYTCRCLISWIIAATCPVAIHQGSFWLRAFLFLENVRTIHTNYFLTFTAADLWLIHIYNHR